MSDKTHHVIIGNGIAGTQAAIVLRERDKDSRITIVTTNRLLCYNRYDLPEIFAGKQDWREFLLHMPEFYAENRINVVRNCRVVDVLSEDKTITFSHKEKMHYDTLLIASGVRGYIPEDLIEYTPLMQKASNFEDVMTSYKLLPKNGHIIMLGGDMTGIDFARRILPHGYKITLVTNEHTFWPHKVDGDERDVFLDAVTAKGIDIIDNKIIANIEEGEEGMPARRVVFKDGANLCGDIVMPFFGLEPSAEFMLSSGVGVERGIMVNKNLCTSNDNIWAAGDVCQIWSEEENGYRFYYGWKNVRVMGEVVAENMTGGDRAFETIQDESLRIGNDGKIHSPFWEYE